MKKFFIAYFSIFLFINLLPDTILQLKQSFLIFALVTIISYELAKNNVSVYPLLVKEVAFVKCHFLKCILNEIFVLNLFL